MVLFFFLGGGVIPLYTFQYNLIFPFFCFPVLSLSVAMLMMRNLIQTLYLLTQRCKHWCMCLLLLTGHLGSYVDNIQCSPFLLRADSEGRGKNSTPPKRFQRTGMTSTQTNWWVAGVDENLFVEPQIRIMQQLSRCAGFLNALSLVWLTPRSVWTLARTRSQRTTWSQRERSFWPSMFSTQMSLKKWVTATAALRWAVCCIAF